MLRRFGGVPGLRRVRQATNESAAVVTRFATVSEVSMGQR